jgi:amidase
MAFLSFSRITLLPLNTTSGSFALLESVVRHDAGIVVKLREAGAIILEKASLSE